MSKIGKQSQATDLADLLSSRVSARYPTHADVRIVRSDEELPEAVVLNLSQSGMGLDGLLHFAEETAVVVEFPNGYRRSGRTAWRENHNSGVVFDKPLNDSELGKLLRDLTTKTRFGPAS